ncbi:MAG TPA: DUF1887 family CARF protein [Ktedonobacteraceae bacterium]|jgi:hypothetical protein|nr:DUF1887 family CARF protein [Ktedonobacteraceae bacterium]
MKKALLILTGGRIMPNVLTILNENPILIVPIISNDDKNFEDFERGIKALFIEKKRPFDWDNNWDTSFKVDAFDLDDIKKKCLQAVDKHQGCEWIFNITSATTIMSMGAYEAAKERITQGVPISCWYLDTAHTRVVRLTGKERDASLFTISVDDYVAVHNRQLIDGSLEKQRQYAQDHWLSFATFLVEDTSRLDTLKRMLERVEKKGKPGRNNVKTYSFEQVMPESLAKLLEKAAEVKLVKDLMVSGTGYSFKLSCEQHSFLDGAWLELYVWNEVKKLEQDNHPLFTDCQWNQCIFNAQNPNDKNQQNELDVSMIYKAQLLVVECKTGNDAYTSVTIYKLDSVTGPLGGRFVSRFLVTSRYLKEADELFKERARDRGITLIGRERLQEVGKIIAERAKSSEGR